MALRLVYISLLKLDSSLCVCRSLGTLAAKRMGQMQSFLAMRSRERKPNNLVASEIFVERAVKPVLDVKGSSRPFPLIFKVRNL